VGIGIGVGAAGSVCADAAVAAAMPSADPASAAVMNLFILPVYR
jgi:hypothetical protein